MNGCSGSWCQAGAEVGDREFGCLAVCTWPRELSPAAAAPPPSPAAAVSPLLTTARTTTAFLPWLGAVRTAAAGQGPGCERRQGAGPRFEAAAARVLTSAHGHGPRDRRQLHPTIGAARGELGRAPSRFAQRRWTGRRSHGAPMRDRAARPADQVAGRGLQALFCMGWQMRGAGGLSQPPCCVRAVSAFLH